MKQFMAASAVLSIAIASSAVQISGLVDNDFAERYAFSTNRAELIATLRPETRAWYVYSILHAQNERRLDDAERLLKQWDAARKSGDFDVSRWRALSDRQNMLRFDEENAQGKDAIWRVRSVFDHAGISHSLPSREVEIQPDTYPSALDEGKISYESFSKAPLCELNDRYRFLAFLRDGGAADGSLAEAAATGSFLADTPGLMPHLVAYLRDGDKSHVFRRSGTFAGLTLVQLYDLAKALKGNREKSLTGEMVSVNGRTVRCPYSRDFIETVFAKLAPSADVDPNDFAIREACLLKKIDFASSLGDCVRREYLLKTIRELLEHYMQFGVEGDHLDLFWRYLETSGDDKSILDDLIADYIAAARRAGATFDRGYSGYVDVDFVKAVEAETDLVMGRPSAEVDTSVFTADKFREIQNRVELKWSNANPRVFAADDKVSLAIDVKNVLKMRVAVFELDAASACRAANGAVAADIDLDCAVPTFERTMEFASQPSVLRHRETLSLPELDKPGVYVVECSGQGISSRAFVRKGCLRPIVRSDAAGHVFTVFDEGGQVVKGAKVWIDGTVFKAEENGEIPVPFASSPKSSGRKTAIVEAGRLAAPVSFELKCEAYSLAIGVALPAESLVAGCEATALIRPTLFVSGMPSSLKIVQNPVLTVTLKSTNGRESVKTFEDFALFDDAESICRFKVPSDLLSVSFELAGSVKRASGGDDEKLSAGSHFAVNGIRNTQQVVQLVMRKGGDGYRIEMRGRTGEPIPSRPVNLRFAHCAFGGCPIQVNLQGDAEGVVRLGLLDDITTVSTSDFGGYEWNIASESQWPYGERMIAVAEGESFELPIRGLLAGKWPGASELANRLSLLRVNGAGEVTDDCIAACSYEGGVVHVEPLPAGDYVLSLRTENRQAAKITVVRAAKGSGCDGAVAGSMRIVAEADAPGRLRIDSARVDADGSMYIQLLNYSPDARVHVYASRTMRDNRDPASPFSALAASLPLPHPVLATRGDITSKYISGRELGDKLRYILDRRQEPGRIGNMLSRPSLLLNPWSVSDTKTKELDVSGGRSWDAEDAEPSENSLRSPMKSRAGSSFGAAGGYNCRDFLPSPCAVFANLRPNGKGVVKLDVASAAGMQDFAVIVTDGSLIDEVKFVRACAPIRPRDLRVMPGKDPLAVAGKAKEYSTLAELCELLMSVDSKGQGELSEFAFLAKWNAKSDDEKRMLYGKYASHETDFFLYEKDRAFFDAVIAPNLRNKRRKDFFDHWLLGDDVSSFAEPGMYQGLNTLEKCLLARRVKSIACAVARELADWCKANPVDPMLSNTIMAIAIGEMDDTIESSDMKALGDEASDDIAVEVDFDEPTEGVAPLAKRSFPAVAAASVAPGRMVDNNVAFVSSPVKMKSMTGSRTPGSIGASVRGGAARREAELNRRRNRQFWRPPERTKEWVESYYYRRRADIDTTTLVKPNTFWRDYAAAVAEGREDSFRSTEIVFATSSLTEKIAALAVMQVGFKEAETSPVVFTRGGLNREAECQDTIQVVQHFVVPGEDDDNGNPVEVKDEFVAGKVYRLDTVVINPTAKSRWIRLISRVPSGAFPFGSSNGIDDMAVWFGPYESIVASRLEFYFPLADKTSGTLTPAQVLENGALVGSGKAFTCCVVPKETKVDTSSWSYVSQKGTKGEVLEYIRNKNLNGIDLSRTGWRMVDGDFARKVLAALDARRAYCEPLWLSGLRWRDSFDVNRIRQVASVKANADKLAKNLGPYLKTSIVDIEPEDVSLFEHREYWPVVNAMTHAKGGSAAIPNESLAAQYRAFLDMLAGKPSLSAKDKLLAAVYLFTQDRIPEAEALVASVSPSDVETQMQLDYMNAYMAFSHGDPEGARAIAAMHADAPSKIWRERFADVIAQADEIAGRDEQVVSGLASAAPSLSMRADAMDGATDGVVLFSRNLESCVVKAYPVDIEIAFSKNPFGSGKGGFGAVSSLRPAWESNIRLLGEGGTRVELPKAMRESNLVVVATGADGRAEERLEILPGAIDVQVVRECRQLRVRDAKGRALPGAYVKVYSRDASGRQVKFHKDGYTDLRGVFDYESVSTDSEFRPSEFAVFVKSDGNGARTLRVEAAK